MQIEKSETSYLSKTLYYWIIIMETTQQLYVQHIEELADNAQTIQEEREEYFSALSQNNKNNLKEILSKRNTDDEEE